MTIGTKLKELTAKYLYNTNVRKELTLENKWKIICG
jgi:hypothetical protein